MYLNESQIESHQSIKQWVSQHFALRYSRNTSHLPGAIHTSTNKQLTAEKIHFLNSFIAASREIRGRMRDGKKLNSVLLHSVVPSMGTACSYDVRTHAHTNIHACVHSHVHACIYPSAGSLADSSAWARRVLEVSCSSGEDEIWVCLYTYI